MKDLIDKVGSYNIFNYLIPGVVYSVLISKWENIDLVQDDLLTGAFLYYLIGLIISRIGSLFVQPILDFVGFVKDEPYEDFVDASEKDSKIDKLSEVNNTYRTLIALFLSMLITKGVIALYELLKLNSDLKWILSCLGLFVLFLFAYRKQSKFITKRIKHQKNKNQDGK
tara:strand:+ start:15 stop:521 length:507 start_codon:yes stop_codon:yes gene_type:complete